MLTSLPNLLTLLRIVIIPLLVALLYLETPMARWAACGLFVVAGVTDYFDGYLARNLNKVSPLGRFLDPIADKLLVAAIILMLVGIDAIRGLVILPGLVILCREILVSGLREYLAESQVEDDDPDGRPGRADRRRDRPGLPAGSADRRGRPLDRRAAHIHHRLRLPAARPQAHAGGITPPGVVDFAGDRSLVRLRLAS
jgi:hypothetical protein